MVLLHSRTVARLALTQVLFLHEFSGRSAPVTDIMRFISEYYLKKDYLEDFDSAYNIKLHNRYFLRLSEFAINKLDILDEHIIKHASCKTDILHLSLLRAGVAELMCSGGKDVPVVVVLNEFTNITASFACNAGFVNSVLHVVASSLNLDQDNAKKD
ncbi:transcription antitermination factor NusB [Candidatus Sneabacter namystus]|uniref:NusB/RsmB/TIM44 domain-containing protein n=1 Tax=Candidatus Sneabacter namystus TaxID=2601646 RepID=A0A5C0UJ44_9RICK|nr:transcription antitermination factor NusB [Candidatus Sneabacter namystus]QEK39482.1 hypothetical protein FZC37_00820 [Candidatus Sneabacter namystus]